MPEGRGDGADEGAGAAPIPEGDGPDPGAMQPEPGRPGAVAGGLADPGWKPELEGLGPDPGAPGSDPAAAEGAARAAEHAAGAAPAPQAASPELPTGASSDPRGEEATAAMLRFHLLKGGGRAVDLPAPAATYVMEVPSVPPGHCPACLAERAPTAESCPRCGLDFLRADPALLAPSDRLARDWFRLRQEWDRPAAHRGFLERAGATGELSAAGRLYRLFLLHHPGDLQATTALDGMMQRALAAGLPRRPRADGAEAERRRRRNLLLQVLVLLLLVAGLAWLIAG